MWETPALSGRSGTCMHRQSDAHTMTAFTSRPFFPSHLFLLHSFPPIFNIPQVVPFDQLLTINHESWLVFRTAQSVRLFSSPWKDYGRLGWDRTPCGVLLFGSLLLVCLETSSSWFHLAHGLWLGKSCSTMRLESSDIRCRYPDPRESIEFPDNSPRKSHVLGHKSTSDASVVWLCCDITARVKTFNLFYS